ncbi:MAG: iron ABC transporter permease [Armatimonadota bacterium]|nr:iron ABC transporter permease [Armatimonadota bacterium]MCX7776728.1 iron ABC transporter permease [Armatimonadota bacterium]MDW8025797.1 iron ABC transporter permease [Armatimonadota bacterium]
MSGDRSAASSALLGETKEALRRQACFRLAVVLLLLAILIVAAFASMLVGQVKLSIKQLFEAIAHSLFNASSLSDEERIVVFFRLPRVALAILVGATLAISGVGLQAMFRNPMADPYLLGISSGGALGAAIVTFLDIHSSWLGIGIQPFVSFATAFGAAWVVAVLGRVGGVLRTDAVLLSGIAVNALLSAIISLMMYLSAHRLALARIYFWLLGGFYNATWRDVLFMTPHAIIGIFVLWLNWRPLNALLLGEETAHYVGIDISRLKWLIIGAVSWCCSGAVAYAGSIGFVGLVMPHMARMLIGPGHGTLMPTAMLFGAIFLVLCDMLSRLGNEIPVGIFTALSGVPFFLFLLRKSHRLYA